MSSEDKDPVTEEKSAEHSESKEEEEPIEEVEDVPPLIISNKMQSYIETELGMVKFIDYLVEESFDLSFRNIDTYKKRFFDQFMKGERAEDDELLKSFNELKIESAVSNIKEKSEQILIENGIKKSIDKRKNRANYIVMGIVFATLIITMWAFPDISNYILIPLMLVVCIVPSLIKKLMDDKWNAIKSEHIEELLSVAQQDVDNLRVFNQLALDDCRDYMLSYSFPLQLLKFDLYSNDYSGLKLLQEKMSNKQKLYYFEFEYPEGIEPFPVPKQVLSEGKVTKKPEEPLVDEESDENDIFIFVEHSSLPSDNSPSQRTAGEKEQPVIIDLLDNAETFEVVENPDEIIQNFNNNEKFLCDCNTPLKFKELRNVKTQKYDGFEFYLGISAKCESCGKNPFIILRKNETDVPTELEDLF